MSAVLRGISLLLLFAAPIFAGEGNITGKQDANSGKMTLGIEEQIEKLLKAVKGKRVGLITNPTGVDNNLAQIADVLFSDPDSTLTAFFAPEHGLRGDNQAGSGVTDYTDPITGLPVYSLYGARTAPTDEQLQNIDILAFDIQDVGVRFYTYIWTMSYAMEAAAKNNKKFIIFDRPNPIGCEKTEGAPNTENHGLVGRVWPNQPFGIATRSGMTVGEFGKLINGEWMDPKVNLEVIEIPGYQRNMYFEDTGRPWVLPSPNMPTVDTAFVYPGMCVFEGVNVSEGRGTTKPFEMIGAPFINGYELAKELNKLNLPGVKFRPAYFQPSFDDYATQFCGGIQVHVLNRNTFDPIRSALFVLKTLCNMYPDNITVGSYTSTLMGVPDLHTRIRTEDVDSIIQSWQANLDAFKVIRAKYLIYPVNKLNGIKLK